MMTNEKSKNTNFKRLIFCFDGTWNNLDTGHVTNVGITAQSIAPVARDGIQQIVYYDEGVGNARHGANWAIESMEKWGGGLFGNGLLANLEQFDMIQSRFGIHFHLDF